MKLFENNKEKVERTPEQLWDDILLNAEQTSTLDKASILITLALAVLITGFEIVNVIYGWFPHVHNLIFAILLSCIVYSLGMVVRKINYRAMRKAGSYKRLYTVAKRFVKCDQFFSALVLAIIIVMVHDHNSEDIAFDIVFSILLLEIASLYIFIRPQGVRWLCIDDRDMAILNDYEELDEYKLED